MKKLLLASTALVMSAGVAAADVSLSGDARMGLVYNGDDVEFNSRARVTFTLSGETSTGLAFGGSFRADQATGATTGELGSVFISGEFGRLSMGDVDGAALAAVGDLYFGSLTGLGDRNEMIYINRAVGDEENPFNAALDGIVFGGFKNLPRALYEYSFDGFSVFVSIDNPDVVRAVGDETVIIDDVEVPLGFASGDKRASLRSASIGLSYTFDGFTGAIGYEEARIKNYDPDGTSETASAKHAIASLTYEFSGDFDGFAVKGIYGRAGGDLGSFLSDTQGAKRNQYGLSAMGTFDEVTVTAFGNRNFFTTDYGIGAAYDLGGGAALTGGIVRLGSNSDLGIESATTADFGLTFSF